jgi:hypothetical protein
MYTRAVKHKLHMVKYRIIPENNSAVLTIPNLFFCFSQTGSYKNHS